MGDNSGRSAEALPALDPNDINIVLMGETGVGKSTFVNAFVNYLKFSTLKEATACSSIHCLIASKFIVMKENFENQEVIFGDDYNECLTAGASATQSTRSYRFFMGDRYIRLIDTPGIGDTRGVGKDQENFERVLDVLGELKFVHAFCILLKPNNAKLTVFFQYCIKQLLLRLNKSAGRNMVFIFTNSRSTFYKPGDGQVPITEILKSIKASSNIDIPFGSENVFCVDNEAFRFLLARKNGIKFTKSEEKDFAASWNKSVDVSFKMLSYVAGLKPHRMQDTISINEARRLILNLYEPVVLMTKNIEDNLELIAKQQAQLNNKDKTIEELKQSLYSKKLKVEVIKLNHPRLVCTHDDCTEVYDVEGIRNVHYKRICADPYYIGLFESRVLLTALTKNKLSFRCDCGHTNLQHKRIYSDKKFCLYQEINEKVNVDIRNETDARTKIDMAIEDLKKQKESLKQQKETIQKAMAKFAHFLRHNAITVYNDTYQEYIQYLINNENNRGPSGDENLIRSYKNLVDVHNEQIRILDEQLKQAEEKDADAIIITAEDVFELVQELYDLENSGEFIRDCYEKQQLVRQRIALLHMEKNVDGRRESSKNTIYNKIMIVIVIIVAIMTYYCIARYKH